MTYVVTDACLESKDQSCLEVCPVDCIYDIGEMLAVHPAECIDCGACESECPVEAIKPETAIEPNERPFVEVNAALRDGAEAAAAALAEVLARR